MDSNDMRAIVDELLDEEVQFMVAPDRVGPVQVFFYGEPDDEKKDLIYDMADDYGYEIETTTFPVSDYFKEIYHTDRGYAYVFRAE